MNDQTPPGADALEALTRTLDNMTGAAAARMTAGLAPSTLLLAATDWIVHLARSPGKQMELGVKLAHKALRMFDYMARASSDPDAPPAIEPLPQDRRFSDPAWRQPPFNLFAQSFLLNQQWWHAATTGTGGVSRHHQDIMEFTARQMLDIFAPSNFVATNPVLQQRIWETRGQCLAAGFVHLIEDMQRQLSARPPVGTEAFEVGKTVATAKGKVVWRNRLMELIQYEPTTDKVHPEPVLIVPAWIMKYYILDLSPENSLVRWLTGQGFTVFMISWHNPDATDRDVTLDDYRRMGPMAALDAIEAITRTQKVHAAGYCLGGTLLSIAAAAMARDGDDRLASVTLMAAQTEFSEPGELGLFIDEGQLDMLEKMMWTTGFLDSSQMGGAFQILRSNDLIWSRLLQTYLMGEREEMIDLMAWNADGTRMPYAMHSEYLKRLFLDDDLAEGRFRVGDRTVSLAAIRAPVFAIGTERDHVAPWRSVHKIHLLTGAEVTFVLTSGGHNAGIVSEPGHPHRHYEVLLRDEGGPSYDPDEWRTHALRKEGSWWSEWGAWLAARSGEPESPPPLGNEAKGFPPLCEAPGTYVLEK